MPDLYELELSGTTHGTVEGFSSSHKLILSLSGASSLSGKGAANDLSIIASGASRLELSDFPVHNANVILSGASHATINLDGTLDGALNEASHLRYIGDPTTVDVNTFGGSTVRKQSLLPIDPTILFVLIIVAVLIVVAVVFFVISRRKKPAEETVSPPRLTQNRLPLLMIATLLAVIVYRR